MREDRLHYGQYELLSTARVGARFIAPSRHRCTSTAGSCLRSFIDNFFRRVILPEYFAIGNRDCTRRKLRDRRLEYDGTVFARRCIPYLAIDDAIEGRSSYLDIEYTVQRFSCIDFLSHACQQLLSRPRCRCRWYRRWFRLRLGRIGATTSGQ